ncbi:similar to stage IV sporulation protein [Lentibacillus persicus]|uniref:Similar to stage IV sporulation protein n=1 Tax=Lentibacillus persicus TaxID=640948 RepID=A0A1I1TDN4_9BACI|nr:sporulation protein YqfD [Lentibacillus persicus]SFD55238.1 similar to stage IV sporulation protein [Lentibacillus persicus]
MKHIQGTSITGYVTVLIKGARPELFFQKCTEQNIVVWNIKKHADDKCTGNVKLKDIASLRRLKRGTHYKLSFTDKHGYPFLMKKFIRKKEFLIGIILSLMLVFFLSNVIWEVEIAGVPKDIEEKITDKLSEYGVHQGAWALTLDSPSEIQQNLINDIPELLWVGVKQKGTSFLLEGVEKSIVEKKEIEGPRNLVAAKEGVIENMYVSKGLPQVNVNDYVKQGDVLVSGKIQFADEAEDDDKNDRYELVTAEGEVIAKTWYETEVSIPLKANYEQLTGDYETEYHLKISDIQIPIWGFGDPDYTDVYREQHEKDLYFFKWKLPLSLMKTTLNEKQYFENERSRQEAVEVGIEQAKRELRLRLAPDAEITSENILQQTTENGKVKLILYIAVEENIVKHEPLDQGD